MQGNKMYEKIYKRYTECFKKENDLINNRITWLLTTQAFLFAALEYVKNTPNLEFVVSLVGLLSSGGFFLSILAAIISYFRFYKIFPAELKAESEKVNFPETNRRIWILILGFTGPILTPIVLIWGWSYLLIKA
jgi:hypothetical protein